MTQGEILVFDTGPLSHFALADWLGVLKAVIGDRTALIPDVVADELQNGGALDSRIPSILNATWIETRELRSDDEFSHFAHL